MRVSRKEMEQVIVKTMGEGWRESMPGKTLSEVYRMCKDTDVSPTLFRISTSAKNMLRTIASTHGVSMTYVMEELIKKEYDRITKMAEDEAAATAVRDFAGPENTGDDYPTFSDFVGS